MVVFCREQDCVQFITQGDVWDAQKDMLLDLLGALSASALFVLLWTGRAPEQH